MKLNNIPVRNILQKNTVSVPPDTSLSKSLRIMSENHISCLIIAEGSRPLGILTERDIIKIASRRIDIYSTKISEVMSSPVITVSIDANILEIYGILRSERIRHLVVLDRDGVGQGVVTQTDIIKELGARLNQRKSVYDVMTRNVLTANLDDLFINTIKLMAERSISCVVVEDDFRPVGLITERDVSRLMSQGVNFLKEKLGSWMSTPVEFVASDTPLVEAIRRMDEKKHRRFLVMDEKWRLTGLITQSDLVRGMLEGDYVEGLREEIAAKENALQRNEERYRLLVEGVRIIGWEYDHSIECFTFVSGKAEEITGYKPKRWYEKGFWLEHIHADDRDAAFEHYEDAVENVRNREFEYRMIAADGAIIWLRNVVDVVTHEDGSVTLRGILFDITAEKRLQQQVVQASKLSSIGTFVAGVAHELNNPLTAVILYADSLVMESAGLSEKAVEELKIIKKQSARASSIVQNLLKFSRKFEPGKSACHVNTILEDTVQLHEYHLKADNIEIKRLFDKNIPEMSADLNQLQQVFSNIIINAYQAMKEANVKGEIRISSKLDNDKIVIVIENDGQTIPEDKLGNIFDPFFTTKEVGEGTGLGLSIAHGIIEEHGGSLRAENIGDCVVRFTIILPTNTEDRPAETDDANDKFKAVDIARVKVLLLEDEESIINFVSRTLSEKGAIVKMASNGKEAVDYLEKEEFDVVLSDIKMPVMTGLELGNWLYENKPEYLSRFVLVTGSVDITAENYCLQHGCRQLVKPFRMDELISTIYNVVSNN